MRRIVAGFTFCILCSFLFVSVLLVQNENCSMLGNIEASQHANEIVDIGGNGLDYEGMGNTPVSIPGGTSADRYPLLMLSGDSPPETWITSAPSDFISYSSVTFYWTGSDDTTPTPDLLYSFMLENYTGYSSIWTDWKKTTRQTYYALQKNATYTFKVKARDLTGNSDLSPAEHAFIIDVTPPDTIITTSLPPRINFTTIDIAWSGIDDLAPVSRLYYSYILEGYDATWTSWTKTISHTYVLNLEGTYTFKVKSKDPAGNIDPVPAEYTFTIDIAPPETTLSLVPSSNTNESTIAFMWTGSDDNTPSSQIDYSYILMGYDIMWAPWSTTTSCTYTNLPDGTFTFKVKARDAAGNIDSSPAEHTFKVDTMPPETSLTIVPPVVIDYTFVTFTWTGTDNYTPTPDLLYSYTLEGYTTTWTPWTSTTTHTYTNLPSNTTTYTFKVKTQDGAGNTDPTPAQHTFTIDTTPPDTQIITSPPTTTNTTTVTFTWTGTDDHTPTPDLLYSYTLEGYTTTWTPWTNITTHTYTYLPNGQYTFKVKTQDLSGNSDLSPEESTFIVNVIDVSPPDTIIVAGPEGIIIQNDITYSWEGFDDISPDYALVYSYILEGYTATWTPWTTNTTHTYTNLPENIYTFKVKTKDLAGNSDPTPAERTCSIDAQPPITNLVIEGEEGNNGWYISNVLLRINASDNTTGVATTKYQIDDGGYQDYEDPFPLSTEGGHTLSYYSIDNAGHQETQKTILIKIDKTPPSTTYIKNPENPNGNNQWYIEFVTVTLDKKDTPSGIKETLYRIDDEGWRIYSRPIYFENEGNHTVYYHSIDNAGNNEDVQSFSIKIDTLDPTVNVLNPKTGGVYISDRKIISLPYQILIIGKVFVSLEVIDNSSGVARVDFSIDGEIQYTDTNGPYEWIYNSEKVFFHKHTLGITAEDNAGNRVTLLEMDIWTVLNF